MERERRARSVGRQGAQEELFEQLAGALRELRNERPVERPEQFKPPQFDGNGDVELFIEHFNEVATTNRWTERAASLHLREALKGNAQEYGRPGNMEAIFAALRSRYGLSPKEARSKLSTLKKEQRGSLHDHAAEVERLVRKAYQELPEATRNDLMLDTFCSSLGNASLQRHLLAIRPQTLPEAVQYGNEYLGVKTERAQPDSVKIRIVENDEPTEGQAASASTSLLASLKKSMELLTAKVEQLQARTKKNTKDDKCWDCQEVEHTRKECKTNPWLKVQAKTGNGDSPQ